MSFKRFTIDDINANKFYQMPKFLFREDLELNNDARVLYSLLRDRHKLSVRNKWVNSKGEVYLIFTRDEMCKILKVSSPTLRKTINMLKTANLMCEERQGCNKPNLIYLNYISDIPTAAKLNKGLIEEKPDNTDNEESTEKILESRMDTGLKEFYTPRKTQRNRTERILHSEQKEFYVPDSKNFSLNKTNNSKTKINKSVSQSEEDDGQTDKIREKIKEQIEYDYFEENCSDDILGVNAIVNCMVEILSNRSTKINGVLQSREALEPYINQVDSCTILEFIEHMRKKDLSGIKNISAYWRSAFINYIRESELLKLSV